ncbi:MAG: hypothetical protein J6Q48_07390 [Bacteroidaceae bacterium]|nr:hypothetical protein [Bacteroidaceae bacterium]
MEKTSLRFIKSLSSIGATNVDKWLLSLDCKDGDEKIKYLHALKLATTPFAYSEGVHGVTGLALIDNDDGEIFICTERNATLFFLI